ncbi:unnamed protein product [Nippostrongylus brasiliensis]|uniref:Uncharacterized protein n=1 Tax=Nippostrongylus brasiliensis TaxID=27835 RepID=A0A0N4Y4Z2_NIPBR|nr:unnamed protein product [Nippostrongylus brasiliensis]
MWPIAGPPHHQQHRHIDLKQSGLMFVDAERRRRCIFDRPKSPSTGLHSDEPQLRRCVVGYYDPLFDGTMQTVVPIRRDCSGNRDKVALCDVQATFLDMKISQAELYEYMRQVRPSKEAVLAPKFPVPTENSSIPINIKFPPEKLEPSAAESEKDDQNSGWTSNSSTQRQDFSQESAYSLGFVKPPPLKRSNTPNVAANVKNDRTLSSVSRHPARSEVTRKRARKDKSVPTRSRKAIAQPPMNNHDSTTAQQDELLDFPPTPITEPATGNMYVVNAEVDEEELPEASSETAEFGIEHIQDHDVADMFILEAESDDASQRARSTKQAVPLRGPLIVIEKCRLLALLESLDEAVNNGRRSKTSEGEKSSSHLKLQEVSRDDSFAKFLHF